MSHQVADKEPEESERFIVFRFEHALGKGIKSRIKSFGCTWSTLFHGWLCPLSMLDTVRQVIEAAKLHYEEQTVRLPKGMIPQNPRIGNRQTRLEILEEKNHKAYMQLLEDIYRYDSSLRPEDFTQLPSEEGKSEMAVTIERDFHDRWMALQETKGSAEQGRKELAHLQTDLGEKIFDPGAPLLIADALIKEQFLWEEHRTLHYCSDTFWQWDQVKYTELSDGGMRQKIYSFLRDAKQIDNEGFLENFNPTKFKVDQIIDALKAICHQDHHPASGAVWLDGRETPNPHQLIAFKNGLLNVESWLANSSPYLMPHTPLLLNVNSLSFDFDPSAEQPHEWLGFLNSIWAHDLESQQTLQEWMGYFLIQDTRHHKILLIIGPPRSGKGTIGRCLIELLGSFNVIGPTLSSLSGEFGLQPFLNKMLALISDARLNGKGNNSVIIERLLSISGEDPLSINRKFLPPLTVQLPTRIMMMSNEIPDMRDASGALAKRYIVLTLTKSWLGKEDTALTSKIRTEFSGILLWALEGLARLLARGKFLQPSSSVQTIEELEAMTSPIRAFIIEKCDLHYQATVSTTVLFESWRSWCSATGYPHAGNIQSFGKNLRAAFPEIETIRPQIGASRERYYKGISLVSHVNPSADVHGRAREYL